MCRGELPKSNDSISRRRFLAMTATAAGASFVHRAKAQTPESRLIIPRGTPRSRVVRVRSSYVVRGPTVHGRLLAEMFDAAMSALIPGAPEPTEAWRSLLKPEDIIGIKFNRSTQDVLGTTPALADVLIRSIVNAGWPASQIVCIEAPSATVARLKTAPSRPGYSSTVTSFGSGSDQFAAVLDQVTALIDVPYLKTHNIAGVTCAMKNLSHGLIKHPARFHANGCSPYIADIVGSEPIKGKLRLCVVDALRAVFDGGPGASVDTISDEGVLLVSVDPVATDATGVALLNETRRRVGLPPIAGLPEDVAYLAAAHRRGLGVAVPHGIDVVRVEP